MSKRNAILILLTVIFLIVAGILMYQVSKKIEIKEYKVEYLEQILKYSKEYDLDAYLVASIIFTESSGRASVTSNKGAVGLMQVMPDTAKWIAGKLKLEEYDMTNPDDNIRFGCWYLNFLSDRFQETDSMLAAYNAGHNKVNSWLEGEYSTDGVKLDEIPYQETRNYVLKVNKTYEKYKKLYPKLEAQG